MNNPNIFLGCELIEKTDEKHFNEFVSIWNCYHCDNQFKASRRKLRERARDRLNAHCGCVTNGSASKTSKKYSLNGCELISDENQINGKRKGAYILYDWKCHYCKSKFEATRNELINTAENYGKSHCGCQKTTRDQDLKSDWVLLDNYVDSYLGCKLAGHTSRVKKTSKIYIWECGFCQELFELSRQGLRGRSKAGNDAHCKCQSRRRVKKINVGRESPFKLDDLHHTVREVHRHSSAHKLGSTITTDDVKNIIFKDCHYCGDKPKLIPRITRNNESVASSIPRNGIDRKDSSIGYTIENCVPCCTRCNILKKDINYDDFCNLIAKIAERFSNNYQ